MTIEYEVPYWNPSLPPPPGFNVNPWESHGSPGPWSWENAGFGSPWNWDGQRPFNSWNWENQGTPHPLGPYSFGNATHPPYPNSVPYFHPHPSYHPQSQGFSPVPINHNESSPPGNETFFDAILG